MGDQLMGFMVGATFGVVVLGFWFLIRMQSTLTSLNARLNMLLKHHGIEPTQTANQNQQVRELLLAGKKIEAIKLYRELTGATLAEAKAAVESLPPA